MKERKTFNTTIYNARCPECNTPVMECDLEDFSYMAGRPGREEMDVICRKCGVRYRGSFLTDYNDQRTGRTTNFIAVSKNGQYALCEPFVFRDDAQGTVAGIGICTLDGIAGSYLYEDGTTTHGWTSPFNKQWKVTIPPDVRGMARQELLTFAKKNDLLDVKNKSCPNCKQVRSNGKRSRMSKTHHAQGRDTDVFMRANVPQDRSIPKGMKGKATRPNTKRKGFQ